MTPWRNSDDRIDGTDGLRGHGANVAEETLGPWSILGMWDITREWRRRTTGPMDHRTEGRLGMAAKKTAGPKDSGGFRIGGRLDHDGQALFEALQFVMAASSTDTVVAALLALTDSLPPGHQDTLRRAMGLRKASLSRLRKSHGLGAQNDDSSTTGEVVGGVDGMAERMVRIDRLAERTFAPIDAAIDRMAN